MKKYDFIISLCLLSILIFIVLILNYIDVRKIEKREKKIEETKEVMLSNEEEEEEVDPIVFEGMTMGQLANQLDKSLGSTLSGTGIYFARYSIQYNVNPYMAVAISLHETGCKWTCSGLVRDCNNVGGMKFDPYCDGTSFGKYDTLEDGIEGFIRNISRNYIEMGLITPYDMQYKYVGTDTTTWAPKVEKYMKEIKEA